MVGYHYTWGKGIVVIVIMTMIVMIMTMIMMIMTTIIQLSLAVKTKTTPAPKSSMLYGIRGTDYCGVHLQGGDNKTYKK